jgi:hypothetical protein
VAKIFITNVNENNVTPTAKRESYLIVPYGASPLAVETM